MASQTYLVADTRERAVLPFFALGAALVVRQINTGDYLICQAGGAAPVVRACIERKTLEDFAASFKDGRYANVGKMLALRAATGCRLFFFVEGPAFPSPSRRFARIPFANILAAITKLMVRDGVHVVQTADARHTAQRLTEFLHVFAGLPVQPGAAAPGAAQPDSMPPDLAPPDLAPPGAAAPDLVPASLTKLVAQTAAEAAAAAWARLNGVSVGLGWRLTREFSVAELAAGQVPEARLSGLRTATGRLAGRRARLSLRAVRDGCPDGAAKLVSGVRGVTPALARQALSEAGGLAGLCRAAPGCLGPARAARVLAALSFRDRTMPDADVDAVLRHAGWL